MRKGMTIIEVVLVVAVVVVLLAMFLPGFFGGMSRKSANRMKEGINLCNIHKAMVAYAGTNKDYFPGLTATGDYFSKPFQGQYYGAMPNAANADEEANGDGCTVSTGTNLALAVLLEEGWTAPAQLISPGETDFTSTTTSKGIQEVVPNAVTGVNVVPVGSGHPAVPGEVRDEHCSFALLAYGQPNLKPEWKANKNPQACVLASRLVFNGKPGAFSGVWTEPDSGIYNGWVVRGDTSNCLEKFKTGSLSSGGIFDRLTYGAVTLDASTESASVVGIFGRSTDMKNFDATPATGMLGSAND